MKKIHTTLALTSGTWDINVFEIGNTYQIEATLEEKSVHLLIHKRDYLKGLQRKQAGAVVDFQEHISCSGEDALLENELQEMVNILLQHMDNDLTDDKKLYGIHPD
jgi:hypothetical protein